MRRTHISALCIYLLVSVLVIAQEPAPQPQISGDWTLTKWVDAKSELVSKGKMEAIPNGVGYKFHSEEFILPGEELGSKRYALPKGIHFRISPKLIGKEKSVIDILLAYTTINSLTDDSCSTSSTQTDGRQAVSYDTPFSVSLKMPDSNVRYKLEVNLHRE